RRSACSAEQPEPRAWRNPRHCERAPDPTAAARLRVGLADASGEVLRAQRSLQLRPKRNPDSLRHNRAARGLSSRFRRTAKDRLRQNGACGQSAAGARRHAGKSRSKAPLALITVECQMFYLRRPGPSDKIEPASATLGTERGYG